MNIVRKVEYMDIGKATPTITAAANRYAELQRELDPDRLLKIAQEKAGLTDFGGWDFIEPYRKLLDCVARDVDFSPQGLADFQYHIVRCLVNRLRIRKDFLLHPEIAEEDVSDPIVVIGMPRTGTTKMQRILSSLPDTDIQKTYLWQMLNPAPFPDAKPGRADSRIGAAREGRFTSDDRPDYEAAHVITAEEPEEDGLLCDATFDDWIWSSVFAPSASYYDWVIQRPHMHNYRHLHAMYQYLQWQNGGRRGRRWVSKNVQHIAYLEELLEFFPNATLIHCHRTPHDAVPSLAKLTMQMWQPVVNRVDPVFAGQAMLKWWGAAMDRYLVSRDRLQLDDRIIDLPYERIRSDATGIVQDIYARLGQRLSATQLQCVERWENDNEQHKHGRHVYSLEQFGLSRAQIDARFGDYIRRFIA